MHPANGASRHEVETPAGRTPVEVSRNVYGTVEGLLSFAGHPGGASVLPAVLGRHGPVSPTAVRNVQRDLAFMLPVDLPGPVLFVGLAEESGMLGAGVHRDFARSTGRDDAVFVLASGAGPASPGDVRIRPSVRRDETLFVRRPRDRDALALAAGASTLALVVDVVRPDLDVGGILRSARRTSPELSRVVVLGVCDAGRPAGVEVLTIASVHADEGRSGLPPRPSAGRGPFADVGGRSGIVGQVPIVLPEAMGSVASTAGKGERILVIGCGEAAWEGFVAAHALERSLMTRGVEVRFAATLSRLDPGVRGKVVAGLSEDGCDALADFDLAGFDRVLVVTAARGSAVPAIPGAVVVPVGEAGAAEGLAA